MPCAAGVPAAAAAGGDAVTMTYTMTIGQAVRAAVGLARQSWAMRIFGIVVILVSIIPLLNGDLVSVIAVVFGIGLLTGWLMAPFAWWQFRKRPDLLNTPTTLAADGDGIEFTSTFSRGRTAWSAYRKVHDVAGCLLLDNDSGVSIIIPKDAFTASELGVFYRLLDRNGLLPGASNDSIQVPAPPSSVRRGAMAWGPSRASAWRYSVDPGCSATASRRCVPASAGRPSRFRLWARAKCA